MGRDAIRSSLHGTVDPRQGRNGRACTRRIRWGVTLSHRRSPGTVWNVETQEARGAISTRWPTVDRGHRRADVTSGSSSADRPVGDEAPDTRVVTVLAVD